MKLYDFLPHTADVKIRAYGNSLEQAFIHSAYALTDVITDHNKIKKTIKKEISVKAENKKALLYDFLEQFLILLDSEGFLLSEIKRLSIKDNKLKAVIEGDNRPEDYETETHVKAMTYQEMEIKKEADKYVIQFVPDI